MQKPKLGGQSIWAQWVVKHAMIFFSFLTNSTRKYLKANTLSKNIHFKIMTWSGLDLANYAKRDVKIAPGAQCSLSLEKYLHFTLGIYKKLKIPAFLWRFWTFGVCFSPIVYIILYLTKNLKSEKHIFHSFISLSWHQSEESVVSKQQLNKHNKLKITVV